MLHTASKKKKKKLQNNGKCTLRQLCNADIKMSSPSFLSGIHTRCKAAADYKTSPKRLFTSFIELSTNVNLKSKTLDISASCSSRLKHIKDPTTNIEKSLKKKKKRLCTPVASKS